MIPPASTPPFHSSLDIRPSSFPAYGAPPALTVALCTHQPSPAPFARALAALRAQTLPADSWELLVIDNASSPPLAADSRLSWHPRLRLLVEPALGVTAARLAAFRATRSDLLLFVDDDNVLAPDYLARALARAESSPHLGCFGGQLLPEFATPPPDWTRPWWPYLALRPLTTDLLAAHSRDYDALPPTAGMLVRRAVWTRYLALCADDPRHLRLGLWGERRVGGEDLDLALCALDLGLSAGRFADLRLTHLMPASRLTEDYLVSLVGGIAYSTALLERLRPRPGDTTPSLWTRARTRLRALRLRGRAGRFHRAELAGRRAAQSVA